MAAELLWCIWQNRNDVVSNGKSKPAAFIYSSTMHSHAQWLATHRSSQTPLIPSQQQIIYWKTPPPFFVKCNVDAALLLNPPSMGCGCILRDHHGKVVGAIHGSTPGIQDPALAEAMGIREALSWFKDLNHQFIQIESDAKLVIDALNSSEFDPSSLGFLLEDCHFLAKGFQSCLFCFVLSRDQRTKVAYSLARAVGSMTDSEGRVTPSPFILNVILVDSV